MHYVYDLINTTDIVEYVGITKRPTIRLKEHILPSGKFPRRSDLRLELVTGPMSKADALKLEGERKISFGMDWHEKIAQIKGARAPKPTRRIFTKEDIYDIRKKEIYQRDYAKKYGVSQRTIVQIQHGLTYKDV